MRYVMILLSVFLVGATVFVSTEKQTIRRVHDAVVVKAWIVEAGIDIPLAKEALPKEIVDHFKAANELANAAINLGADPGSTLRADAVLEVVDPLASCIAKGACAEGGAYYFPPEFVPPAVTWSLPTSNNLCAYKDNLDTWGKTECAFYGRGIVGTGINDAGDKGRVVCAGKPTIRIRLYCE